MLDATYETYEKARAACPELVRTITKNSKGDYIFEIRDHQFFHLGVRVKSGLKVGDTIVMSCRWPVPFQGSFVTKTSPGRIV